MPSMTKVELDLNLDVNMYLLFEKGMRHIVLYISKRYSQADNQQLRFYDPKKPKKYITYFDKNNLWGYVMAKSLPPG